MWTAEDVRRIIINPFYAINIADSLFGDHPPMVSREEWVAANARLIDEFGQKEWLELLLDTLETGGVTQPPDPSGSEV